MVPSFFRQSCRAFLNGTQQAPSARTKRRRYDRPLTLEPLEARELLTGTWVALNNLAPTQISTMMLLSDGTVMAQDNGGKNWSRLRPDSFGSYVNGSWSTLAPMHDTRLYYASNVLQDGRVFVAGGEYGTGTKTAEVYDPLTNVWTYTPTIPWSG